MKILYVIGSMQVGGAETHLLRIATELSKTGDRIHVFAFQPEGPLRSQFEGQGIGVYGFAPPLWMKKILRHPRTQAWVVLFLSGALLWWKLWRLRPQVVHFFLPAAYIVGGLVSLLGPPVYRVMSRRSLNHYQLKHRLFARIEYWLHPRMDVVIGNSQAVVHQLMREGVPSERLRLIYNGIDASRFQNLTTRSVTRMDLGVATDACIFIVVANLIPYKGHEDLINACALITNDLPRPWMVLVVGRDDGIGAQLQRQANSFGVGENFMFLGSRQDIPELLACSDVGVLCSHEEGFSNAVLESMAAGLPMVVTDVGGNREAVQDGYTGYVVPSHSPSELAKALLKVSRDPDRQIFGERGSYRVTTEFSMSACVKAYQGIYDANHM